MISDRILTNANIGAFILREVRRDDFLILGKFFDELSEATRNLYGPHPLDSGEAKKICLHQPEKNKNRFIAVSKNRVIGYFLFDFDYYPNELNRFKEFDIHLDFLKDPVFAPCISDDMQGKGIASDAMPSLIEWAKSNNLRSLVLMGGTQEPNNRARKFYNNFGFMEYGRFFTENNGVNNIDMRLLL